jgi:hypothetical protein
VFYKLPTGRILRADERIDWQKKDDFEQLPHRSSLLAAFSWFTGMVHGQQAPLLISFFGYSLFILKQ